MLTRFRKEVKIEIQYVMPQEWEKSLREPPGGTPTLEIRQTGISEFKKKEYFKVAVNKLKLQEVK